MCQEDCFRGDKLARLRRLCRFCIDRSRPPTYYGKPFMADHLWLASAWPCGGKQGQYSYA